VVPSPGEEVDPDALRDRTARYLARFKVPRDIEVVPSLPKLATGKVLRRALRGEEVLGGDHAETAGLGPVPGEESGRGGEEGA
jgi:acyl-CoA synthetase (AMP-forming)/AMP-acid ligase II